MRNKIIIGCMLLGAFIGGSTGKARHGCGLQAESA